MRSQPYMAPLFHMTIDVSAFHKSNVIDSCSLWNVLSSELLYRTALAAACSFCCTSFVEYECLHKRRAEESEPDNAIKRRFVAERDAGMVPVHSLEIADLQDVAVLRNRRRLSMGELSSIVFAYKTNQAVLTDDQKARKLANTILPRARVQTTPHLVGWLCFTGSLGGEHLQTVLTDHQKHNRPLSSYFEAAFCFAVQFRQTGANGRQLS
jgi:hypothetical protein